MYATEQSLNDLAARVRARRQYTWRPGKWGRRLTRHSNWSVSVNEHSLRIDSAAYPIQRIQAATVSDGIIWSRISISHQNGTTTVLDGLTKKDARLFLELLTAACTLKAATDMRSRIDAAERVRQRWEALAAANHWLSQSEVARFISECPANQPDSDIAHLVKNQFSEAAMQCFDASQQALLAFLDGRHLPAEASKRNKQFLKAECKRFKAYFDSVEANPLTDEQREAVITFDDNVMTVAAAGSGKTSVLVAKSGYALLAGLFRPEEILLLAFNRKAADELAERVASRLGSAFDGAHRISVETFHSLGLRIIGQATGKRPIVAPWIEQGREIQELENIVEQLSKDRSFAANWNQFRTLYARSLPPFGEKEEPEWWDPATGRRGFRTWRGDTVKSQEERMICNWLSSQGVDYEYERAYEHDTANEEKGQYQPDFYYPSANVYHEHFALDKNGKPPKHFTGYADGVRWKRKLHAEYDTTLIETTSHGIRSAGGFDQLADDLKTHGVVFGESSLTPDQVDPFSDDASLLRVFRTFLAHVKSNRLSMADLRTRAKSGRSEHPQRDALFLDLFDAIWREWDRRLANAGAVDFEDMLGQATEHLAAGRATMPYKLVMADEFQDTSRVRGDMLRELTRSEDARLFVVGDDWQAVNRFAGADISLMRDFEKHIGPCTRTQLSWTFRCPQDLCDFASAFVSENPYQIKKNVKTTNRREAPSVICHQLADMSNQEAVLKAHVHDLARSIRSSTEKARVSAYVLGRYRTDRPAMLSALAAEVADVIDLRWSTIHAAKGLEADYVFLVNVIEASKGFPSKIEDDSTLWIAMPDGEDYPYAEERRLFYVALTRARRKIMIYTDMHRRSEFICEIEDKKLGMQVEIEGGEKTRKPACQVCGRGVMVARTGKFGEFLSCSRFPKCDHTENIARQCPKCKSGKIVPKQSRYGRFFSCNRYPQCDYKHKTGQQSRSVAT